MEPAGDLLPIRYHAVPMKRKIFTLFSAFSFAVCVATFIFAACFTSHEKHFWLHQTANEYRVWTLDADGIRYEYLREPSGKIVMRVVNPADFPSLTPLRVARDFKIDLPDGAQCPGIFAYRDGVYKDPGFAIEIGFVLVTYQAIAGTTALGPVLWLLLQIHRVRLRRKRAKHHQCLQCGYDLRESLSRCPECGTLANVRTE
jgi:hypothetical protein